MPPEEESPTRTLQVALSAMAVVAVTVGLIVGGIVLGISKYAGVDQVAEAQARQAPASMSIPPYEKTPTAKNEPRIKTFKPSPSPTVDLPDRGPAAGPAATGIALTASPLEVAAGQQIHLTGSYGREGASLQIQRQQGGAWTDFPVSATVTGASFDTWIVTSQTGTAPFRVVDEATGARSNTVVVTIR